MRPWPRSIRVRLAATITAALALVLSMAALVTYLQVSRTLYEHVDTDLGNRTRATMQLLEKQSDASEVARLFYTRIVDASQVTSLQLLSRDGLPLYLSPNLTTYRLPISVQPEYGTLIDGPRVYRYYANASAWYTISLAVPVNDIEASLLALRVTFYVAVPVALLITLLLGYTIARRGLHPVDVITDTARLITSQNLKQRIPVPPVDDEVGRLAKTLNDMIMRLEGSFTAITQFTTNAAHELRTPLTILRGENELALRQKNWTEEQRDVLRSNIEEVNRLTAIVEDLFLLVRADSNALTLSYGIVSLRELLDSELARLIARAAAKQIAVTTDCTADCTVVGDRQRLAQVMLNMVDNAVKYSAERSTLCSWCATKGSASIHRTMNGSSNEFTAPTMRERAAKVAPVLDLPSYGASSPPITAR
jgi:two-component system OmpR family sensor kinase